MDFKSLIRPYFRDHAYVGRSLIFFKEIHSTNLFLLENNDLLEIKGLVVHAQRQTKGIGRKGRTWEYGIGKHLFCSFVIHHDAKIVKNVSSYPLLIGLAVYNSLIKLNCKNISLKWPNDVLINRKKVSGILCQGKPITNKNHVIIAGIGVNISGNSTQFSNILRHKATTLEEQGIKTNPEYLLDEITKELESIFKQINFKGIKSILKKWENASNSIGCKIKFFANGKELSGEIIGLDEIGRLKVLNLENSKCYKIESGEIEFNY